MPTVLRAVVATRQWLNIENTFATSMMEESVTNLQFISVLAVVLGLMMIPFVFGSYPLVGILGFVISIVSSQNLTD